MEASQGLSGNRYLKSSYILGTRSYALIFPTIYLNLLMISWFSIVDKEEICSATVLKSPPYDISVR